MVGRSLRLSKRGKDSLFLRSLGDGNHLALSIPNNDKVNLDPLLLETLRSKSDKRLVQPVRLDSHLLHPRPTEHDWEVDLFREHDRMRGRVRAYLDRPRAEVDESAVAVPSRSSVW